LKPKILSNTEGSSKSPVPSTAAEKPKSAKKREQKRLKDVEIIGDNKNELLTKELAAQNPNI